MMPLTVLLDPPAPIERGDFYREAAPKLPPDLTVTEAAERDLIDVWARVQYLDAAAGDLLGTVQTLAAMHRTVTDRLAAAGARLAADNPTIPEDDPFAAAMAMVGFTEATNVAALVGTLIFDGEVGIPTEDHYRATVGR